MRKILWVVPALLVFFLVACASSIPAPVEVDVEQGYAPRTLYNLGGLEALKTLFIEDAGKIRLILLLSPT